MVNEVLQFLLTAQRPDNQKAFFFDGTLGAGGYADALLRATSPWGVVIGVDKDPYALENCRRRFDRYIRAGRLYLLHADFRYVDRIVSRVGVDRIHGAVLDLGVSSDQLDDPERGFSFMSDGPLDMRMNPEDHLTAAHVVNNLSEHELARIFSEYGEERYARRIARAIVAHRKEKPIERTQELVKVVKSAIPARESRSRIHPATRVFQALRIYVNDELGALRDFLSRILDVMAPGAVLCILSFHSLEDRMVKRAFREWAQPCRCPPEAPMCTCGNKPGVQILTKKALFPSPEEVYKNPRARSGRLRAIRKVGP
ncbi:16S rRNA (cytosine1402-N4)-methyltransferase [Thermodesulforhabdus norvegica]|uniref:Ribosomal RNA small subunit methyltransferase H n=2 Tax=Thermodesulforhabdus norvegica TaxID=39841 RepID=A0A1I4QHN0_9BACT|nr:16S rRNA (cytosine1402-N4)-methyltransferase [Thermodesulforhabdus norvegica]